ncbi:hypothetical protein TSUD_90660 [Trifolium subterraneum]|uniref:Uncharacterized protein n=1 Tax=Trifolium subterraneum TaxID=3900 RepID=A0A2Z6NDW4_TRISU|nr:hypothetical protein TSUD_90660 [Trifolium subterraneum]
MQQEPWKEQVFHLWNVANDYRLYHNTPSLHYILRTLNRNKSNTIVMTGLSGRGKAVLFYQAGPAMADICRWPCMVPVLPAKPAPMKPGPSAAADRSFAQAAASNAQLAKGNTANGTTARAENIEKEKIETAALEPPRPVDRAKCGWLCLNK